MTTQVLSNRRAHHATVHGEGFADSFNFFALIVMSTFVVAIAFALVGLSTPSWLGFA